MCTQRVHTAAHMHTENAHNLTQSKGCLSKRAYSHACVHVLGWYMMP